jgi:hypothetical protein
MRRLIPTLAILGALAVYGSDRAGAQHGQHPMDARGKAVMGFDQDKTTHHFLLYEDGGAIDVSVKDAKDAANRDAILLVHDTKQVPGAAELARLKALIKYSYVETPAGGRVDIVATDKAAVAAVHEFLRFQIADHKTGDGLQPVKRPVR